MKPRNRIETLMIFILILKSLSFKLMNPEMGLKAKVADVVYVELVSKWLTLTLHIGAIHIGVMLLKSANSGFCIK